MATESVDAVNSNSQPGNQGLTPTQPDDLEDLLTEIGEWFYWEGTNGDQDKHDFVDTYRKRLDAYYINKFLKVVGRGTHISREYLSEHGYVAQEATNKLRAELKQAIKQLGDYPTIPTQYGRDENGQIIREEE